MILLFGIPSEPSLRLVADALEQRGAPYRFVSQRDVRDLRLQVDVDDDGLTGRLTGPDYAIDLDDVTGVYLRLMDDRELPELRDDPPDSPARACSRALHDLIGQWADLAHARVVNRYEAMGSNFSKPYQGQLIAEHGFDVPETLVTNDPEQVRAFAAEHAGGLIYKSISGARSIVTTLDPADSERLERIRWCPVQFQELVGGPNVRVHTVGDAVYATRAESDAVDYRYATAQVGTPARLTPFTLPDAIAQHCVALARALGLEVAGLDLKLPPDGRVVCLEVNPSPVFSYYEAHTGQPIAAAIARLLATPVATRDARPLAA